MTRRRLAVLDDVTPPTRHLLRACLVATDREVDLMLTSCARTRPAIVRELVALLAAWRRGAPPTKP